MTIQYDDATTTYNASDVTYDGDGIVQTPHIPNWSRRQARRVGGGVRHFCLLWGWC